MTLSKHCSDYAKLMPDYKCVETPDNHISGLKYPTYIVTKKDSSTELLMIVIKDNHKAKIYKQNFDKLSKADITSKLEYTKTGDHGTVFIVKFPENENIFTALTDKSNFSKTREVLVLGNKLLKMISSNRDSIGMVDINVHNIILGKKNDPRFLFVTGVEKKKSSVQELSFALGIVLYTIVHREEPFSRNFKKLNSEIKNSSLEFKKDTSMDLVNIIIACLTQSNTKSSFDSLHEKFIKIINDPKLDSLKKDQALIPSNKELTDVPKKMKAISITFIVIYIIAFLIGSITFCTLKKPLEEQQRNNVNPMMDGLERAERGLQVMQGNRNVNPPNQA
jgi:hypothetical protein